MFNNKTNNRTTSQKTRTSFKKSLALLAITGSLVGMSGLNTAAGALERPTRVNGSHGAELGQGLERESQGLAQDSSVSSLAQALLSETIGTQGQDVSAYQPTVDFKQEYSKGSRFVYVKSSEGSYYSNPYFSTQYTNATNAGLLRGAYHFATPDYSSGAVQAKYFVSKGGGWSADGKTLPGLLDMEWNPYGQMCYNMTQTQMRAWIQDFVDTYKSLTGRAPAIYTASAWWNTCVGNTKQFSGLPLHIANYNSTVGAMPSNSGWTTYDIWQYTDSGKFAGDSNTFNGTLSELQNFAKNASYQNKSTPKPTTPVAPSTPPVTVTSPFKLNGAIGDYYLKNGAENKFGKLLNNEYAWQHGSMKQDFNKGYSIIWASSTGTYPVYNWGDIGWHYSQKASSLGVPVSLETSWNTIGAKQVFRNLQNGYESVAYWSPSTGTKFSNNRGAINAKYLTNVQGYGFPSTDETSYSYGAKQNFSKGGIIYWSEETGARSLHGYGAINAKYLDMGGAGKIGFPRTDEYSVPGGAAAYFKKGSQNTAIYWSEATGAKSLNANGAIYWAWKNNGYLSGLGYPVTDEFYNAATKKVEVHFSKGKKITWTEAEGTRIVNR